MLLPTGAEQAALHVTREACRRPPTARSSHCDQMVRGDLNWRSVGGRSGTSSSTARARTARPPTRRRDGSRDSSSSSEDGDADSSLALSETSSSWRTLDASVASFATSGTSDSQVAPMITPSVNGIGNPKISFGGRQIEIARKNSMAPMPGASQEGKVNVENGLYALQPVEEEVVEAEHATPSVSVELSPLPDIPHVERTIHYDSDHAENTNLNYQKCEKGEKL